MSTLLPLFDDFDRTDTNRDNFTVERYAFLNNSAVPEACSAREKIVSWSDGFLITQEFLKRFRSKLNKQHTAALFELFVFFYFKNKGFDIQNIEPAESPTPDFKINGLESPVYIECTCSSNSGTEESIETLQAVILDSFKKIDKHNYFINIEWLTSANKTPSLKTIKFLIKQFIALPNRPLYLLLNESGWKVKITLIPANEQVKRGIGFMQHPAGIVTPQVNVLTALKDKRPNRYKIDDAYIIALHSEDMFLDYLDMDLALFDGATFQNKLPLNRGRETAFFLAKTKMVNSSVSAVLLVQQLSAYSDSLPKMMLFTHPEPKFPLPVEKFPMPKKIYMRLDETTFEITDLPAEFIGNI